MIDTAGIRIAKDEVEKIGISKSKQIAKDADLVIAIFDGSKELSTEDMDTLDLIKNKKSIIILNKIDLESKIDENNLNKIATDLGIQYIRMDKQNNINDKINEVRNIRSRIANK